MITTLVTAAQALPVSLEEQVTHMVTPNSADDAYITGLIRLATEQVERLTGRKLVEQTWQVILGTWPSGDELALPFGELQQVSSVIWYDTDRQAHTWSSDDYVVDSDSVPGRIVPAYGQSWPSGELFHVNPVKVEFVSGYGGADAVPEGFKHAIKVLVAHWYENREATAPAALNVQDVPHTFDALINPLRLRRC